MPVHSSAISTPSSLCGSSAGLRIAVTRILWPAAIMCSPSTVTLAGEAAMHAVIAQQMRVGLDRSQIVHGDDLDVAAAALDDRAQYQTPDAAEAVDRDSQSHSLTPCSMQRLRGVCRPLAA